MANSLTDTGPLSALRLQTQPMSSYEIASSPVAAPVAEEEAAPEEDSTAALYRKARETLLASRNTGMDPLTTFLLTASQAGPGGIGGAISRGGIAAQQVMAESAKSDQARQLKLLELGIEEKKYKDTLEQRKAEKEAERAAKAEEEERERKFKAEQEEKDRETRREVARIVAQSRIDVAGKKPPQSVAARDKYYANELAKWEINGKSIAADQLSKIDDVINILESGSDSVSGRVVGNIPRVLRSEASKNAEDLIGSIVQSDLRQVLGGQFAQREGENLLKRAYASDLEEDVNLQRVKRLKSKLLQAIEAKNEMSDYFNEHETLQGYKGKTVDDIYQEIKKDLEGSEKNKQQSDKDKVDNTNPLLAPPAPKQ